MASVGFRGFHVGLRFAGLGHGRVEIAGGGDFVLLQILDAFEILRGVGGAGGGAGEIGGGLADERFVGGESINASSWPAVTRSPKST